jgi:2,4-dienoyl-CoA reductase-like NADH-dependent reductase (Old Yellow Enzyme family)/pyruvate/2-oxoglutarate dehydrogenase complex dihydrolipoamide dehydrogenase (E3) component
VSLDVLFSPFSIGTLEVQNRIVMPPMATRYATLEGFATDRQIAYYVERARGGVGYITVEHTGIHEQGKAHPNMLLISSDEHASRIEGLIEAVHSAGGKIIVQINHAGRQTSSAITGSPIVGPSPIPCPTRDEIPRELSTGEIEEITEVFTMAAQRVKEARADGVELHMAHGYLLCSFLSPFSNRRRDQYGGDIQGRARFALEVLKSVRDRVGPDFPISCRLSGDEYVEGGLKIEETKQIAQILEKEGADVLHVSACNAASGYLNHPPYYVEEGVFVHLAEAIKSVVNIPVITVGRIRNPAMADQVLQDDKADLVSMGRALIADPHMPKKAKEGRLEEINLCISCNRCIQTLRKEAVRCAVNPETGNEDRFRFSKTDRPKRVWIVGGGPGGLKAAEITALRGHQVTLFERDHNLGGRMRLAALPPKKAVLNDFLDYLERRVRGLGVTLELDKEFTPDMLGTGKPDAVIVASGALPLFPDWKGMEESGALSVDDILSGEGDVGKRVLVVGAGGIGAETADYLSEMGKEVTLVEMLEEIAADLVVHLKHYLSLRLAEKGVTILTSTKVKELGKGYALVENASGTRKIDGFDTIVLAVGSKADDRIAKSLEGKVPELHVIGDASEPREALEAVYEGEETALKI